MNENKKNNIFANIQKLRQLLTRRDKFILMFLFFGTVILSIIETFGISIIMPFITFTSNPSMIFENKISNYIYHFLNFKDSVSFMLFFSVILVVFYIFRAVYNVIYNYSLNRFAFRKFHYFSYSLFSKALELSYFDFINKKTDKIRTTITQESLNASQYVQNALMMFSEIFIIILLYMLLLLVSWKMTIILSIILGVKVLLITKSLSYFLTKKADIRFKMEQKLSKIISETFGNFKILKLKGNEKETKDHLFEVSKNRSDTQAAYQTLILMPRNILESLGFSILIACVAYILYRNNDASSVLPIISMYALALYRILPSITKILNSYSVMIYSQNSVNAIYEDLIYKNELEGNEPIEFKQNIELKQVTFGYKKDKTILKDFNLKIHKGEKIAFVGHSGAGKSTLVDIIVGLYHPSKGDVHVDGIKINNSNIKSWRKKIGYIPQNIYLFDGSVAENIAFGSDIDKKRLIWACKMANIYDFLEQNEGLDTLVGEGGVKLSGGQKQRIGIARAIYDNPEILVLDEATSALDVKTEAKIMDEIYNIAEDKTLLIIAHRLSTIQRCDRKIEL